MTCRHCGEPIRAITKHARLSAGPREAHDRAVREADLALAAARATYDREHSFSVLRLRAAARGNAFPHPVALEIR